VASEGTAALRADFSHVTCHPGFRHTRNHRTVSERVCSSALQHRDHRGARRINLCLGSLAVSRRGWLKANQRGQGNQEPRHCDQRDFIPTPDKCRTLVRKGTSQRNTNVLLIVDRGCNALCCSFCFLRLNGVPRFGPKKGTENWTRNSGLNTLFVGSTCVGWCLIASTLLLSM
jgi:hypothetical protein